MALVFSSYLLGIAPSFPTKEVRIKPGTVHYLDLQIILTKVRPLTHPRRGSSTGSDHRSDWSTSSSVIDGLVYRMPVFTGPELGHFSGFGLVQRLDLAFCGLQGRNVCTNGWVRRVRWWPMCGR